MPTQQSKHVFISYIRENQDQVDRLVSDLEKAGVEVWIDRHSIKPGARWKLAIQEAIRQGDFFIACFSKEYTSKVKALMNEELTLAIEELRQYAFELEWLVPVFLSECEVPSLIEALSDSDMHVRADVARALSVISDPRAVPALIRALVDKEYYKGEAQVQAALINIGKEAIPSLEQATSQDEIRPTFIIQPDCAGRHKNFVDRKQLSVLNTNQTQYQVLLAVSTYLNFASNLINNQKARKPSK